MYWEQITVTTMQRATIPLAHFVARASLVSMAMGLLASILMNVCTNNTIVTVMLSVRMSILISSADVNRVLTVTGFNVQILTNVVHWIPTIVMVTQNV